MRVPYFSLLAIFGLYMLWGPGVPDDKLPALARTVVDADTDVATDVSDLPDPRLTPGAVLTVDVTKVCTPGFAKTVRHTSQALKFAVYAAYRIAPDSGRYQIDHLIPLQLGGADVAANLWPQSDDPRSAGAGAKDRLENFLHREVCAHKIPLRAAQAELAKDWRAAYRKYLGNR